MTRKGISRSDFMLTSRFPKNLGDDVLAQNNVEASDDGNAYAFIKLPPDENLLHNEVFQGQYISGAGEITNPDKEEGCGVFKSAFMNKLKHLRVKRFTCHLQGCPKCFRVWARRQAASAAGYLWAFVDQYKRQLTHWVLSPSEGWKQDQPDAESVWKNLDKELRLVVDTFKGWNDTVVMVVRHPSRKRCPTCKSSMKDNQSFCIPCGQPAEWYWSPHLHVITDFRFPFEESSNYTLYEASRRIIFTRKSIPPNKDELENVISYELGHALYLQGQQRQAVRYMGMSAKTHYRSEVTKVKEDVSEPDPLDPNVEHKFYMLQNHLCDEKEPGLLIIKKHLGKFQWELDIFGNKIPLRRTRYVVRVVPLGRWLNGRWTRLEVARKVKPLRPSSDVQPQILAVEPFQPFY